jgi:hypothetical protein
MSIVTYNNNKLGSSSFSRETLVSDSVRLLLTKTSQKNPCVWFKKKYERKSCIGHRLVRCLAGFSICRPAGFLPKDYPLIPTAGWRVPAAYATVNRPPMQT